MAQERLSEKEIELVRICQEDIPLCEQPFKEIAKQLQVSEQWIFDTLKKWKENKILRRFKAILYHRNAGYRANGMSIWAVPPDRINEVGKKLSSYDEVSHCYQRPQLPGLPYNVYGMIHAKNKTAVEAIAQNISQQIGISDYRILYSVREFKKSSMKYFVPEVENLLSVQNYMAK